MLVSRTRALVSCFKYYTPETKNCERFNAANAVYFRNCCTWRTPDWKSIQNDMSRPRISRGLKEKTHYNSMIPSPFRFKQGSHLYLASCAFLPFQSSPIHSASSVFIHLSGPLFTARQPSSNCNRQF